MIRLAISWRRAAIAALCGLGIGSGGAFPEAGPMVGHTTPSSALIWAYDSAAPSVTLEWCAKDSSKPERVEIARSKESRSILKQRIEGLRPDTHYIYQLRADGGDPARGSFRTPPAEGQGCRFRYVLTSCMDAKGFPVQKAWDEVLRREPAFHLLVGDNVYADSTDYDRLVAHHLRQRAIPNFARLLATTPTWATWDDHDYGPNDSHGSTPGKEESLRAFKDVWANPSYGTSTTPGVFHSFRWGDVDFFVLDDRYHRTDERAPHGPDKSQFGEAQLDWLFERLRKSTASFKVIATGYDIMSTRYPDELRAIARRVRVERIDGIVFNAGDIHRTEFKQQDHGMGYPVTQITSSGIARNPERPWAMIEIDTTAADPTMTARFFTEETQRETHLLRLSELRHAEP